jgi:hypothetical protein
MQMKKKYSSARPYSSWLAEEVVTLDEIIKSVPPELCRPPPIKEALPEPAALNGCVVGPTHLSPMHC